MSISIKTPEDIAGLRIAGRLAAELLDYLTPFVKPGVSTGELDRLAYDYTVNVQGCIPACLGYCPPGMTPYPATTCISINHVVCHGIPSDKKILKAGDLATMVTGKRLGHPVRSLRTAFARNYSKAEYSAMPDDELEQLGVGTLRKAVQDGNLEEGCFLSGQIAAMVTKIEPAADIVRSVVEQAEPILRGAAKWVK